MRFGLVEFFSTVFVCAFGCAALVRPTEWLTSLFLSFTFCILLAAVLCAIARRGEVRFFWIGFAVAGIGYLWFLSTSETSDFDFDGYRSMATTKVVWASFDQMHGGWARRIVTADGKVVYDAGWPVRFIQTGQFLWALSLGWVGGHFTRWVHSVATEPHESQQLH